MKRLLLTLNFLLVTLTFLFSQGNLPPGTYTSTNKKAIKHLEEGHTCYETHKDAEAEKHFLKAIEEDKNFVEPHIAIAYLYMEQNKKKEGIYHLQEAVNLNPQYFPRCYFDLALAQLMSGLYEDAQKNLESYLKFERINPTTKEQAQFYLKTAKYSAEAVKKPKPFNPVNLGPGVNSPDYEYFPSITADGKTLVFTRNFRKDGMNAQEDFFVSKKTGQTWENATPLKEVNSNGNEGAPSISADGQYMFFASCLNVFGNYGDETRKGFGSCDIFFAQQSNGKWVKPINIGPPVNTANWETQPSFSSDGKTLYFIRGMVVRGDIKEQDIYMSEIGADGRFSTPVKLGSNINTPGKEESVYIHPDNQTLYFSSDGHPENLGGLDIYMSKKQADGSWGPAINLGYPINTFNDENSLLVDPSGKIAYFASDREGGFGGLDLYGFELPADVRPNPITYVKGKVFDANTKEPLESNVELIDLEIQKTVVKSFSNSNGEFLTVLTADKNYLVNVNREGYLFYSDNFSLKNSKADFDKPFILEIPLQPIDTGISIELKNIFFDVDKFDLKPESKAECEKLVSFLKQNPKLRIEISGHTDSDGNKKANQVLSQNRAKAVFDYAVAAGIAAQRLTFKGYGDSRPKVPNTSPENKAMNRRTEIKITGK
ncbi:MAG TPA: OmpA family protein [Bacteroidia bacterium]|nr:OmpA family protein [Bacteroidia bacterium]